MGGGREVEELNASTRHLTKYQADEGAGQPTAGTAVGRWLVPGCARHITSQFGTKRERGTSLPLLRWFTTGRTWLSGFAVDSFCSPMWHWRQNFVVELAEVGCGVTSFTLYGPLMKKKVA